MILEISEMRLVIKKLIYSVLIIMGDVEGRRINTLLRIRLK